MKNPMLPASPVYAGNAEFIEDLYERYLTQPASVSEEWRQFFASWKGADSPGRAASSDHVRRLFEDRDGGAAGQPGRPESQASLVKQVAVMRLIQAHRGLGHHRAAVDSIRLRAQPAVPDLDPSFHGLAEADMDTVFQTGNLGGRAAMTLREIVDMLRETYTGSIGSEFLHISEVEEKRWLQTRLEATRARPSYGADERIGFLSRLAAAEGIEHYLHAAYAGQKRFSLEGGETTITALDTIIASAGGRGIEEMVIGMAHRGRLNVLVNIMGKSPKELFAEFEGLHDWKGVAGDVKYHQGYSTDIVTPGGVMHVALGYNPSHLEIVDPVICGSVRARQERRRDHERKKVMAVLLHGDASFAGQGVVYETLNLSQTRGYTTGGTIHIVINNRIGFTTSHPLDARSTLYCTDVGKVVQAPIFHVNGDDPEAVAYIAELAVDYRMTFRKDVLIDLVCYRRYGHNEADEPAATQPRMYRKIRGHDTVTKIYASVLEREGVLEPGRLAALANEYRDALKGGHQVAPGIVCPLPDRKPRIFAEIRGNPWTAPADTSLPMADIRRLGSRLCDVPEDFELHPRVAKIIEDRRMMAAGAVPADWGFAETLAYASLVETGHPVRISGQDTGRGTFFHRHAVLLNQRNGDEYVPLQHVSERQARFTVINSILSEEAALGFEYGFSAASPDTLVVWEAQFGDFANGAQVVIDQFVVAAEQKWRLLCGLVLMLPHGHEGQGPEHTSARIERFLQMAAQDNLQICHPSTPAQMFHLLRRQIVRPYRKPLVIFSPKSLLRRKASFSPIDELAHGRFREVVGESEAVDPASVERLVLCSGKVYYDLVETRREKGVAKVAIARLEQLNPYPAEAVAAVLGTYPNLREVVWTQEEPENQGAWCFVRERLAASLGPERRVLCSSRPLMAAPSGGDYRRHLVRQKQLVDFALGITSTLEPPADSLVGKG
ncbi:MAG: 2-oxoglutarate dehydrogenase E1 component [Deltaproteobacteria bacterium]|nr:2-oxoglutarate dehydrogenase E1 component [Deltaproteobacteria bacterium]